MSDADISLPPPPVKARRKPGPKPRAERPQDDRIEVVETQHARPTRAETVQRERRRRDGIDKTANLKLSFRFKPDPNKEYRWINEGVDGQRLKDLTVDDDWTMVTKEGEETTDTGSAMRRAVGESKNGPIYAYLCEKPKDWYEQDRARMQERDDQMMSYIKEGRPHTAPDRGLTEKDHVYGEGVRMKSGVAPHGS